MTSPATLPKDIAASICDGKSFAEHGKMQKNFAWIRENKPLAIANVDGYLPFWVVSKYKDLQFIASNNECFSTTKLPMILMETAAMERVSELTGGDPNTFKSLVTIDEPDHRKHRNLFADWFLPASLKKLEVRIRELAVETLESLKTANGQCDFVKTVSEIYPRQVIREIIGVPKEEEWRLSLLGDLLFSAQDPEVDAVRSSVGGVEFFEMQRKKIEEMCEYFEGLMEERKKEPKNDVLTLLADAEVDGKPLEPMEKLGHIIGFASAGHHTTAATIACIIWQLAEHPEYLVELKSDKEKILPFIHETLRFVTPAKHFMRTAIKDVEVNGQQIKAGDWVYLSFPSANYDEEVFENPFTFNPARENNRHFSFGIGVHRCIGQPLGILEQRILIEEMLKIVDTLELSGDPALTEATWVQGPKSLPISFTLKKV